ncbi:BCCT family transporter [Thermotalea metallivorans]|uniref:Glycine betaine transporter BetL n=1 Tax=Thermotalea metallivorans TaxID=520762 RepID=A0A140L7C8_9FIRM|nr:BCCT family transporter [Thermotalea metallivorans]KXG76453.1 Glycine betaine transporter BetL [Thermotalea metallivorans]
MEKLKKADLRMSIFIPMSLIFILAIVTGIVAPEAFYHAENKIAEFAFLNFGWLFQISGNIFLFMCLYLTFSKYGDIKLGGKDAEPELSYWNWFAISLCAGIGTGILFWGVVEPLTHMYAPPEVLGIQPGSEAAAMFSMTQTLIHWTYIPYAMYAIAGAGIAYAVYNVKLPFQVSSMLYPLFGKKIKGAVGAVVDNICLFAIAGGVAAILGVGTMQIGSGLNILWGIETGKGLWIIIVAIIVATYIISSYTGLQRGIRWLSDNNAKLFLLMLAFIFIFGPTRFILNFGTQATGHFLQNFFERTHFLSPVDGSPWPRWWPIYYWAIWLAYAPLSGMFFARISKGRTIRQFMMVNLILPATFGLIWFSVFGGAAIHLQMNGAGIFEAMQAGGNEVAVFSFLKNFPLSGFTSAIYIIAIYVSIVTLADSMTSTISSLSTTAYDSAEVEPPGAIKIFWGIVMSSLAIINLICAGGKISGIDATKQISTVAGFPILFLMVLMAFTSMYMIVKQEKYDVASCPETAEVEKDFAVGAE